MLYLNSPSNPTGGVLTRAYLERLAAIAQKHDLWVISDEAYEDVVFDGEHVSIASLPGMYERTFPLYTFSKSYAITGLRLGYIAINDAVIRDRAKKILFYTASNVASVVQYGGIGALEGPQDCIEAFRTELRARRDLFYRGRRRSRPATCSPASRRPARSTRSCASIRSGQVGDPATESVSWRMVEYLIKNGRIGCVPGVDFGAERRRLRPLLLRARSQGTDRRAGFDEAAVRAYTTTTRKHEEPEER